VRTHPPLDVDVVVGALVANRLAGAGLLHDQPRRLDRLAQVRGRAAVLGVVPGLIESFYPRTETEAEAPARHLVDVEGAAGGDEGAAGEGPGDPGGAVDALGLAGEEGCLRHRGAEQLRRPDALDSGRLGSLRLGKEVGNRGADRGDRDPLERTQANTASA